MSRPSRPNNQSSASGGHLPKNLAAQLFLKLLELDEQIELQPVLDQLTARPPLDLAYGEATEPAA
jgi:Domain of unknown function (DUF1931)